MKKTITIFLSVLLLCSMLASCATDPNASNTKKGAEIGAGTGVGVGAATGGVLGAGAGLNAR